MTRLTSLLYNRRTSGLAPEEWIACGFSLDAAHTITLGDLTIVLARNPSLPAGLVAWGFEGLPTAPPSTICGIPAFSFPAPPPPSTKTTSSQHPNTITHVDHVVAYVADAEVAKRELGAIIPLRAERKDLGVHQMFFRSPEGGTIIEVIGGMEPPNRLWGLTFCARDIEAAKEMFFKSDTRASNIRDARQPGRRIMTLRHEALDIHTNLAVMSPHVKSSSATETKKNSPP